MSAGGEQVHMEGLGVQFGDTQLLYSIHHKEDALFLTPVADGLEVAGPAVAPFQGGHHQNAGVFICQLGKVLHTEAVVRGLADPDIDLLLPTHHAPGKSHLDKFQIGGDDVVAGLEFNALSGNIEAMGGALHQGDLLGVGVQKLLGLFISLVAQGVHGDVMGTGIGFVLTGGHISEILDSLYSPLGSKAHTGHIQECHGIEDRKFLLTDLFPIDLFHNKNSSFEITWDLVFL